jgi:hypothetical protein
MMDYWIGGKEKCWISGTVKFSTKNTLNNENSRVESFCGFSCFLWPLLYLAAALPG